MNPKDIAQRNLQRERQQRGDDFQAEMFRSWLDVPACWHKRLKDGGGSTEPADYIALLENYNVLMEYKRTSGSDFQLNFLRSDQIRGLMDFDNCLQRNLGLVVVSFHNPDKGRDEAYIFRLTAAIMYMHYHDRVSIPLSVFRENRIKCVQLHRVESAEPKYDLRGAIACFKSL